MAPRLEAETITLTTSEDTGNSPAFFTGLLTPGELRELERDKSEAQRLAQGIIPNKFDPEGLLTLYLTECSPYKSLGETEQLMLIRARTEAKLVLEDKNAKPSEQVAAKKTFDSASHDLTTSCLMLVFSIAIKFTGKGVELLDLIQVGNIGLIRALDKYKESKNAKFSTCAWWWIRQAIQEEIASNSQSVSTPNHSQATLKQLSQAEDELFQNLKREPTNEEIAEATGHDLLTVQNLIQAFRGSISLNLSLSEEEEIEPRDLLPDHEPPVDIQVRQEISKEYLQAILPRVLNCRQLYIIQAFFGLGESEQEKTLEAISKEQGVTRANIHQIKEAALKKLGKNPQIAAELASIYEDVAS